MIILASLFLTNDETIQGGSQSIKIFIISIVIIILTDLFMYIYSFFFFSFPTKSQRKLFNLVSNNHQLKIIKEWDKIENRMQKFEIIGMILSALIWIFCFYVSFGFTIVWKNQNNAFLITFAMCFGLNYIVGEFLIEFFIALLYLDRKHNSFFRWCAERLNNLRNIRCLSP
jgi:predicted PurR-regulated permease PerM